MINKFTNAGQNIFELIFPTLCVSCGVTGVIFCDQCKNKITFAEQICIICKSPCPDGYPHPLCAYAFNGQLYPQRTICICNFKNNNVKKLVHAFKYQDQKCLGTVCANIIISYLQNIQVSFNNSWTVSFVPLHKYKFNLRGYNPAQILAQEFAKISGIPCENTLKKIKQTRAQMQLNRAQRHTNLQGAFTAEDVQGKNIILVDDVATTFSTLLECTATLKNAGAQNICLLSFAKD